MKKDQIITIKIDSLGVNGEGVGSFQGFKIFVDGALPGEEIETRITFLKKNYAQGDLYKILTKSPRRQTPICKYFHSCGGCQLMHLNYEEQLKTKQKRVNETLKRVGHITDVPVSPCTPSPQELAYRNKIQLPILNNQIGLFKRRSHELIPIDHCHIHCKEGQRLFEKIAPLVKSEPGIRYLIIKNALYNQEAIVILVTEGKTNYQRLANEISGLDPQISGVIETVNKTQSNVILGSHFQTLAGSAYITEKLLGKSFKISAASFFQVNPLQAAALYTKALECANLKPADIVLDAYCGVGTLALFASDFVKQVVGIEVSRQAIDNAKENARLNNITNAAFYCGKAEELTGKMQGTDVLFLNPPRTGCQPSLLEWVKQCKIERVVYISCDPATLARDLALLKDTYKIVEAHPFDMFPQTMHVETVVKLTLQ